MHGPRFGRIVEHLPLVALANTDRRVAKVKEANVAAIILICRQVLGLHRIDDGRCAILVTADAI